MAQKRVLATLSGQIEAGAAQQGRGRWLGECRSGMRALVVGNPKVQKKWATPLQSGVVASIGAVLSNT
eukprot:4893434-Pleurochrysis_carterae.AAC.1